MALLLVPMILVFAVGMAACNKQQQAVGTICDGLHAKNVTVAVSLGRNVYPLWGSFLVAAVMVLLPWLPCHFYRKAKACTKTGPGEAQLTYLTYIAIIYVVAALGFVYIGCGLALWGHGPRGDVMIDSVAVDASVRAYAPQCTAYAQRSNSIYIPIKV